MAGRRAAGRGRLVQPVHVHAGRHSPRAHRAADRGFHAAAVHVRACARRANRAPARSASKANVLSGERGRRRAGGAGRRRRCSGSAAAAARDAAVDTSRWLYRVAWQAGEPLRRAGSRATPADSARRVADLRRSRGVGARAGRPTCRARPGERSGRAGQRLRIPRRRLGERQAEPPSARRRSIRSMRSITERLLAAGVWRPRRGRAWASCICGRSIFRTAANLRDCDARRLGCGERAATRARAGACAVADGAAAVARHGGAQAVDGGDGVDAIAVEQVAAVGPGPRGGDGAARPAAAAGGSRSGERASATRAKRPRRSAERTSRRRRRRRSRLPRRPAIRRPARARSVDRRGVGRQRRRRSRFPPAGRSSFASRSRARSTRCGSCRSIASRRRPGRSKSKSARPASTSATCSRRSACIPGIKDAIVPLGIEASGVVTAVGEGVDAVPGGRRSVWRRAVCVRVARPHGRVRARAQADVDRPRRGVHDPDHVPHGVLRPGAAGPDCSRASGC